jgi:hypothetical protein
MSDAPVSTAVATGRFRTAPVVLVVLSALSLISLANGWYARQVALPRYCQQPELALQRIAAVITESRPAGDGPRRDYIVATKLLHLVPRTVDEPFDVYLERVRYRLRHECRKTD